jgi:hypothetical protein
VTCQGFADPHANLHFTSAIPLHVFFARVVSTRRFHDVWTSSAASQYSPSCLHHSAVSIVSYRDLNKLPGDDDDERLSAALDTRRVTRLQWSVSSSIASLHPPGIFLSAGRHSPTFTMFGSMQSSLFLRLQTGNERGARTRGVLLTGDLCSAPHWTDELSLGQCGIPPTYLPSLCQEVESNHPGFVDYVAR